VALGLPLPSLLIYSFIILIILFFLLNPNYKISISNKIPTEKSQKTRFGIWSFIGNLDLDIGVLFIISGAISNIIDRIYFGCVIDFIDLRFWPVFNLADIYITIGAIILIKKQLTKNKEQ
jgi:lipoprotein signal peptidase